HRLLRRPLAVAAGLGTEGDAAAPPVGRAARALACAAGALLAPRLLAAAPHFGPRARALRAGARGGELRGDHLVHDGDVRNDAEQRVVELDRARGRPRRRADVGGGHRYLPPLPEPRMPTTP